MRLWFRHCHHEFLYISVFQSTTEIYMISCQHTGWTNDWDGDQSFFVPAEHVMVGVTSEHDSHHE
ncbi:hypothetical protein DPMN_058926 [Dreissena polymorpha]|uniref:Uncharacterized protein n=1 Tax=Dreissena polymorpha TaxID=45954 RepID=A0A9D4C2C2_DREPO|nr:hypothetical protein DPMN_058566 [Dreissena polymorpha]KAH3716207.1 hypothetical protein DPMN_058926 [Dreissena polymorpha]